MVIHFVACRIHVKGTNLGKQIFYIFNLILLHVIVKFTSGATSALQRKIAHTLVAISIVTLAVVQYCCVRRSLCCISIVTNC
jgi:hypothetical protein